MRVERERERVETERGVERRSEEGGEGGESTVDDAEKENI